MSGRQRGTTRPRAAPPADPASDTLAAERAVLGACLLGKLDLVAEYRAALPGNPFADPLHGALWRAIGALADEGVPPDTVTVPRRVQDAGDPWREPADRLYTHDLYSQAPLVAGLHHARIVAAHAAGRAVVEAGTRITQVGRTADLDTINHVLDQVRADLDTLVPKPVGDLDTWAPVDLGPALAGNSVTAAPVILARTDGVMLLYPGRIHSLAGEPESGKSWFALAAVVECVQAGDHVLYLDFEDTPEGIAGRCLALGATVEQLTGRLHYIRPDRPIDAAGRAVLAELVAENFVSLAVVDGVTEAMTVHGFELDGNTDAARFYEALPRFLTHLPMPPAVLLIDHVVKDEERRGRYAIGAQHKLAGLDGVAYMVDVKKPFAPGQAGWAQVWVAKDRNAMVVRHARMEAKKRVIAELWVDGDDERVRVELRPPRDPGAPDGDGGFRPTGLMDRISRYVETHPGLTQTAIFEPVHGKTAYKRRAIDCLVEDGFVRVEKGARNTSLHFSIRPFRERAEDPGLFDSGNAS